MTSPQQRGAGPPRAGVLAGLEPVLQCWLLPSGLLSPATGFGQDQASPAGAAEMFLAPS